MEDTFITVIALSLVLVYGTPLDTQGYVFIKVTVIYPGKCHPHVTCSYVVLNQDGGRR